MVVSRTLVISNEEKVSWQRKSNLQIAKNLLIDPVWSCLLYTSDAADERSSVDLGGRRIIKKKKKQQNSSETVTKHTQTRILHAEK